jgi:hypothetical protein
MIHPPFSILTAMWSLLKNVSPLWGLRFSSFTQR